MPVVSSLGRSGVLSTITFPDERRPVGFRVWVASGFLARILFVNTDHTRLQTESPTKRIRHVHILLCLLPVHTYMEEYNGCMYVRAYPYVRMEHSFVHSIKTRGYRIQEHSSDIFPKIILFPIRSFLTWRIDWLRSNLRQQEAQPHTYVYHSFLVLLVYLNASISDAGGFWSFLECCGVKTAMIYMTTVLPLTLLQRKPKK